jgi:hypothetical protein
MGAANLRVGGVTQQQACQELTWSLIIPTSPIYFHGVWNVFNSIRSLQTLIEQIWIQPRALPRNEIRVLSFEPPSTPDDFDGRLDRILGLRLDPLRLTLEHVSLEDFKPEYTTFRTAHLAQWSTSQVDDAWCEHLDFELGSTSSDVFHTIAGFTWGDYTAISYMWGSPEDAKTITINGMPVTVGENLAAALECLRRCRPD